jgi:hypothetical protein
MTLELIEMSRIKEFLSSIRISLARAARHHIKTIVSLLFCLKQSVLSLVMNLLICLGVIVEKKGCSLHRRVDILESADDVIKSSFLKAVRGIKATRNEHAIWSINAVGLFSISHLSSKDVKPFHNPNFTQEQVILFKEFTDHEQIEIDPEIINDIYMYSRM